MQFRKMVGEGEPTSRVRGELTARAIEEYAESQSEIWEGEYDQIAPDCGITRCRYVSDGASVIYEETLGATSLQRGCLRGDRIAIAVPDAVARGGRWQGATVPQCDIVVCRGGDPLDLLLPAGSQVRVAVVGWQQFAEAFEALAALPAESLFPRRRHFVGLPAPRVTALGGCWGARIGGAGSIGASLVFEVAEAVAIAFLAAPGVAAAGRERAPRSWAFRRVCEHLDGAEVPTSAGQLASALGMNLRTLHNACSDGSGTSPGRLLKLRRLNRARRTLLESPPDASTVASLAGEHGFTELGRFAGEYRRLFGELPSETLRRARAPLVTRLPGAGTRQAPGP